MNCNNCGKEVDPDWKVCPFCSQTLAVILRCEKCGIELKLERKACPKCGTPAGKTIVAEGVPFNFCWIPPGKNHMGSEEDPVEEPVHIVEITRGLWLGRTEVTQRQWQAVMGTNPSFFPVGGNNPVDQVSWDDCQEFIRKLNGLTKKSFRLPTEAEWEYACRAGVAGEICVSVHLNTIAWHRGNSNDAPHPVGEKRPNPWGLFDILGNVEEWCQDWYDENYYSMSPANDPQGPTTGSYRVVRGGDIDSVEFQLRCAYRNCQIPTRGYPQVGFRLALDLSGK